MDTKTDIVYRKEQFTGGLALRQEVIVCDKRYRKDKLVALLKSQGLTVSEVRCVRVGQWEEDFPVNDKRAKEILIVCEKPIA